MNATLLPLLGFAVAMTLTPGPNNVMLTASGANHGLRATVPHLFGIAAGFALMLAAVSAGVGGLLLAWPPLFGVLRWIGAAWLLYLAYRVATTAPPGQGGPARRPLTVLEAAAFQWINPKAWLIAVGAAANFMRPDLPLAWQSARIALVFLAVALPCMLPWALLGSGAARLLKSRARVRAFNLTMAALLVASVVPVLLEG